MKRASFIRTISLLAIMIMASIPGIIGPIFKMGQFGGSSTPIIPDNIPTELLLTGVPAWIIAFYAGYYLIWKEIWNFIKLRYKAPHFKVTILFTISVFISCCCAWIICQEIDMLLDKILGIANHDWFDGITGLPGLIFLSIGPNVIAAFFCGILFFIVGSFSKNLYPN